MPSIGITGGIACGKSRALAFLTKKIPCISYSADEAVARFLKNDPAIKQELLAAFGPSICSSQGNLDKNRLRALLIEKAEHKKKLEAVLHPRLQREWQPKAQKALNNDSLFFIAEIPLLYEIPKLLAYFDSVIVIASSPQIQQERLQQQRCFSPQEALAFLQLQLPLDEKIARAHYIVWNDGSSSLFEEQLTRIAQRLILS
ncbi:MAG: dephospho-CoA kinase [Chthoniobacterales bacterium]|nr:dephospho-CoA kinase [Chthoniobacterales bacterium]